MVLAAQRVSLRQDVALGLFPLWQQRSFYSRLFVSSIRIDSKRLSSAKHKAIVTAFETIPLPYCEDSYPLFCYVGQAPPSEIDTLNIREANIFGHTAGFGRITTFPLNDSSG
jgi:hypothetical protein